MKTKNTMKSKVYYDLKMLNVITFGAVRPKQAGAMAHGWERNNDKMRFSSFRPANNNNL